MLIKDFNKEIRIWCPESEFSEIYKINHPDENHNEVHFIKDGIRVCCVKDFKEEYFYLNAEIYLQDSKEILTLRSGKEQLLDTAKRDYLLNLFKGKKMVLENRSKLKAFIFKVENFLNKFWYIRYII